MGGINHHTWVVYYCYTHIKWMISGYSHETGNPNFRTHGISLVEALAAATGAAPFSTATVVDDASDVETAW